MQRIGALMRHVDAEPVRAGLALLDQRRYEDIRRFKDAESWRSRLVAEGETAVEEMIQAYPSADRQRLRQLLRNAGKPGDAARQSRSSKLLFRYIIALLSPTPEPPSPEQKPHEEER